MYAAGKIPGSFFRREGRAGEKATLTARMIDRPIRPLFPKGWHYETQIVCHPDVRRPRPPLRHPRDERRLRRARGLRHPVRRPRSARCGSASSRATSWSTREEEILEELELDLIVAGTDEAILMVEAGAEGVTEAEILDALDIAHEEIKKLCAAQRELREQGRQGEDRGRAADGRPGAARARSAPRTAPSSTRRRRSRSKLARQDATKAVEEEVLEQYAPPRTRTSARPGAARRGHARLRQAREGHHPPPDRGRQEAARRPRRRTRSGRSSARWTSRRACTARRSSPAGRRRSSPTSRSGRAAWTCGSTTSASRRLEALLAPLQLPALLGRGGGLHARPEAPRHRPRGARRARSACRRSRARRTSPTSIRVVSETLESNGSSSMGSVCASSMALMAAGVQISQPGRRSRDGPDQGGRRLRRPHRHRRRRGPPRRHGLQGRRHRGGHHRPADGHQDLGRHVRHPARRARAGPRRAACSSSTRWTRRSPGRARSSRSTRRGSRRSRSTRRRSAP